MTMIEPTFIIRPELPDRFDILKGSITTKWAERQPSKINPTTTDEKELNDAVVWIQWYRDGTVRTKGYKYAVPTPAWSRAWASFSTALAEARLNPTGAAPAAGAAAGVNPVADNASCWARAATMLAARLAALPIWRYQNFAAMAGMLQAQATRQESTNKAILATLQHLVAPATPDRRALEYYESDRGESSRRRSGGHRRHHGGSSRRSRSRRRRSP